MIRRWGKALFFSLLLGAAVCWLEGHESIGEEHTLFAVGVTAENGREEEIECWQNPYTEDYYVFLPSYGEEQGYRLCLNPGDGLELDGKELSGNTELSEEELDFGEKRSFSLRNADGTVTASGVLTFQKSDRVAALYIRTDSGSMEQIWENKDQKEGGSYRLVTDSGEQDSDGPLAYIKGRGNSTWDWAKKPYRVELKESRRLLGMGKSSSWVLLANYTDNSYIRNKIVYDLADAIGLEASPKSEFVDLYLNGVYAGLYQLSEKLEVSAERLNLTDGYLMEWEIDGRMGETDSSFRTEQGQTVLIQYPKKLRESQVAEAAELVQQFEDALYAENGVNPETGKSLEEYIDLESWARKYLIEEISKNHDGGISSQYFYLKHTEKGDLLYAGPVWDYDGSLGNGDWSIRRPEGLLINQDIRIYNPQDREDVFRNRWFAALCRQETFWQEAAEQYETCVRPAVQQVLDKKIDDYLEKIQASAAMDKARWDGEESSMLRIYRDTLEEHGEYLKDFLEERLAFLDRVWIEQVDFCTVCFCTEYGSRNFYFQVERGKTVENPPTYEESFDGKLFAGWYYDEACTCPFEEARPITENITVYAKWVKE